MTTARTVICKVLILMLLSFNAISVAFAQGAITTWGGPTFADLYSNRISGADFMAVSAGDENSFLLRSDGSIVSYSSLNWDWVEDAPNESGFVAVDSGGEHGIAMKADGSLVSWGIDDYGIISYTPTGSDFIAISAGGAHALALKQNGSLVSWGNDQEGQVSGQPSGTDFVAIAAGEFNSFALRSDGTLASWGDDSFGQISNTPSSNDITAIASGGAFSVAIRVDGTLVSWGADNFGQVSQTPIESGFLAVSAGPGHGIGLKADGTIVSWGGLSAFVTAGTNYVAIAAGTYHSLALKADGTVSSWNTAEHVTSVDSVPAGEDYTDISTGDTHLLALKEDGSLLSLGEQYVATLIETPTGTGFVGISAGSEYNIALKQDGSIVVWGDSDLGAPPTGNSFTAISAGLSHGVALKSDGSISSWGEDWAEQVSTTPTDANYIAIAAGESHSVAIRADGSLLSWGSDDFEETSATPTDSQYIAISAGYGYSTALRTDGSIVVWGSDEYGQITDAPNDTDIVAISAGACHAVAQHSDGSITSWGCDDDNQVTESPAGTDFIGISAGTYGSYAITGDVLTPPSFVTPAAGTTLAPGDDIVVQWLQGDADVTDWWLFVGSSFGARDYHDSGVLSATALQETIANPPADGSQIYIRLWYRTVDDNWEFIQRSIVASGAPPAISSPANGDELNGAVQLFEWQDNGANITDHQLYVGSSIGLNDYFNSGLVGTDLSATAVGLPTDGDSTVYVRLWYKKSSSTWAFTDTSYQAGLNPAPSPVILNRAPGAVLLGMEDTFEWDVNGSGATHYWLQIGSAMGSQQYYSSDMESQTMATVSTLPTNGSPVWVRLWYRAGSSSQWAYIDNQYVASGSGPELMISGGNNVLMSPDDTFSWSDSTGSITSWWLYVGSAVGGKQYENSGPLSGVASYATTQSNLPSGGGVVHARLWYQQGTNAAWQWIDRQFDAAP